MPRVALEHYEAHYQQQGAGPDVVLIHGFTRNLAMWVFSGLVTRLKDRYRVTAYDLRGHGASSAPLRGYDSATLADDFAQLHEALGLESARLVGHSLGGVVALHAAVRHGHRVEGILLSDSYIPGLSALEPQMAEAEVWVRLRSALAEVGHEIGGRVDFRRLLDTMAGLVPEEQSRLVERLGPPAVRWLTQLAPLATTSAAEEVFEPAGLTETALESIHQPVVALYDEQTPFAATYAWLLNHLPNCNGDRVPGASHLALLQNPGGFAALVDKHLAAMSIRAGTRPTANSTSSQPRST